MDRIFDVFSALLHSRYEDLKSGRVKPIDGEEALVRLREKNERRRAEILAAVDQGEASLARGEGRRIATREETTQLATDIKRRGRARLNNEEKSR